MRVNKSGHQGGIAQIYRPSIGGAVYMRAGFHNPVALYEDFPRCQKLTGRNIEQSRRLDHDWLLLCHRLWRPDAWRRD